MPDARIDRGTAACEADTLPPPVLEGLLGHENISTAIPLIQEDQLSVNGEIMYAKYIMYMYW